MKRKGLYHDYPITEAIEFGPERVSIELPPSIRTERDREMVGIVLSDDLSVDFDAGEIKLTSGQTVEPEIWIITESGRIYVTEFENARGEKLAGFHPDAPLPRTDRPIRLEIRSDIPFKVKKIIWTTYSISDMK